MAELKTKPTEVSAADFIDAIEDETKREEAKVLLKLMTKVTGKKPVMWGPGIIGFGSYRYKYASGTEGDWMIVGFSPRKAAHSLYGLTGSEGAGDLLAKLGKHTTGKGCLYVKKLKDVDLKIVETLITNAMAAKKV
jgi:hypothetical protein